MKEIIMVLIAILGISTYSKGQQVTIVSDRRHLAIVNQNAAARLTAETTYQGTLNSIRQNTDNIGINTASLAAVNRMIVKSLTEVNEGLKDAIQVKNIGVTIQGIIQTSDEVLEMAANDPVLLLFAEEYIRQAKERSFQLAAEVSGFILSEGNNILINYNVRDELINKTWQELQIINAYMLAVRNSMYWAKLSGVFRKLNPYQDFINKDQALFNQIVIQRKILQQ